MGRRSDVGYKKACLLKIRLLEEAIRIGMVKSIYEDLPSAMKAIMFQKNNLHLYLVKKIYFVLPIVLIHIIYYWGLNLN